MSRLDGRRATRSSLWCNCQWMDGIRGFQRVFGLSCEMGRRCSKAITLNLRWPHEPCFSENGGDCERERYHNSVPISTLLTSPSATRCRHIQAREGDLAKNTKGLVQGIQAKSCKPKCCPEIGCRAISLCLQTKSYRKLFLEMRNILTPQPLAKNSLLQRTSLKEILRHSIIRMLIWNQRAMIQLLQQRQRLIQLQVHYQEAHMNN